MWRASKWCCGRRTGRVPWPSVPVLDGRVTNAGVARYKQFDEHHLVDVHSETVNGETILLTARTSQSDIDIAEAARTRVTQAGRDAGSDRHVIQEAGFIAQEFSRLQSPPNRSRSRRS